MTTAACSAGYWGDGADGTPALPRTASPETGKLNTESRRSRRMSDSDNSVPLGWILLFVLLVLGAMVAAISFVGGSVF